MMARSSKAEVWDELAPGYDDLRVGDAVYRAGLYQAIEVLQPSGVVLDAGCGTGLATRLLLGCSEIRALDFSKRSLEVLEQRIGRRRNLKPVHGDLCALPFPDETFDSVLCANAFPCLSPVTQACAASELRRVLKPLGRYAVSVHSYSRAKRRKRWVKEGRPGQAGVDYIFRYSRTELLRLFPGSHIRAVGFYALPGRVQITAARYFGELVDKLDFGHMLIAYGSKDEDVKLPNSRESVVSGAVASD